MQCCAGLLCRGKLPLPEIFAVTHSYSLISDFDNASAHDGRLRTFPHERGNWATFVYISGINLFEISTYIALKKNLFMCTNGGYL